MNTNYQRRRLMLLAALVSVATVAWAATCQQDCAVDLKAALDACEVNYAADPDNLKDCRENAKREYQACLEDCRA